MRASPLCEVGLDGMGPTVRRLHAGDDLLRALLTLDAVGLGSTRIVVRWGVGEICDDDVAAESGELGSSCGTDAVVGAGHQGDATVERRAGHGRGPSVSAVPHATPSSNSSTPSGA